MVSFLKTAEYVRGYAMLIATQAAQRLVQNASFSSCSFLRWACPHSNDILIGWGFLLVQLRLGSVRVHQQIAHNILIFHRSQARCRVAGFVWRVLSKPSGCVRAPDSACSSLFLVSVSTRANGSRSRACILAWRQKSQWRRCSMRGAG
jgi:hypothetical protein